MKLLNHRLLVKIYLVCIVLYYCMHIEYGILPFPTFEQSTYSLCFFTIGKIAYRQHGCKICFRAIEHTWLR